MYKTDLREFDVLPPKLFPDVLGPPANLDWTRPWHHILHDLNCRNSNILKATSERIQAVEGNLTPKLFGIRHAGKNYSMFSYSSKPLHQHPALDEFAMMLEKLFAGSPEAPMQPVHLTEELFGHCRN